MKVRYLIPMQQENPDWIEGSGLPRFIWKPEGTLVEHKDSPWLVRIGVAEPADEECEQACAAFWNEDSKQFLQADYDQKECAHTTGDSRYDSEHGEPAALMRMRHRLIELKGVPADDMDNVEVMKAHLKLVKELKVKANERLRRERTAPENGATNQNGDN